MGQSIEDAAKEYFGTDKSPGTTAQKVTELDVPFRDLPDVPAGKMLLVAQCRYIQALTAFIHDQNTLKLSREQELFIKAQTAYVHSTDPSRLAMAQEAHISVLGDIVQKLGTL